MPIFRGKNIVSAISDYKDSVRVATRSNVDLTVNVLSIDGILLSDKDRVLLLGQSSSIQNGIYVWSTVTKRLRRAEDADSMFELSPGSRVYVEEGNSFSRTTWTLITQGVINPGTTPLLFAKESRMGTSDVSGVYGGPNKTLEITVDETGVINSITEIEISLDGGSY